MSRSCLYVGNLPHDFREDEVFKLFDKYGPIEQHEIKHASNNTCFAFIQFRDYRSAADAIQGLNGYEFVRHWPHHLLFFIYSPPPPPFCCLSRFNLSFEFIVW